MFPIGNADLDEGRVLDFFVFYKIESPRHIDILIMIPTFQIHFGNINDDRNTPSEALPSYMLSERLPKILNASAELPQVFALCEIRVNSLDMVTGALADLGYKCEKMAYAPGQEPDNSFYHVIAWKCNETFEVLKVIRYWFTETPLEPLTAESRKSDPVLLKFGESFEKGTLCIVVKWGRRTIAISSNHFGLLRQNQVFQYTGECASLLATLFNQLRRDFSGVEIVAGSDFNAFDDTFHVTNICMFSGMWDITPAGNTFCAYPWDFGGVSAPHLLPLIAKARESVKNLVGEDFISTSVKYFRQLYGGPLKGRLDRILVSDRSIFKVNALWNMDSITLDKFSVEPPVPSDHIGYVVTVKP